MAANGQRVKKAERRGESKGLHKQGMDGSLFLSDAFPALGFIV